MARQENHPHKLSLTYQILYAMLGGIAFGLFLFYIPHYPWIENFLINGLLAIGGQVFLSVMKMLVVPVVFVSLVCGITNLGDPKKLGRLGLKTILLYIFTTCIAISLGLTIASLIGIGKGTSLVPSTTFVPVHAPSLKAIFIGFFPTNPFDALARGDMLQIIVFSILLGTGISLVGSKACGVTQLFNQLNHVVMKLITMIMYVAPYGVFCLIAKLLAKEGVALITHLLGYFLTVLLVLIIHLFLTNSIIIKVFAKLNPLLFFRKMYSAMLFAFSTSSSNVSIPVVLATVERKLGVHNSVAAFVIPLGATINMDGTAIMQGVATVFIANAYQIDIGISGYLMVVLTATLASIGTAGVPSVGLITLAMVLRQVGLPVEGIALIIGVDRILDMVRTAVNITGDSAIACLVAKSENELEFETYNSRDVYSLPE